MNIKLMRDILINFALIATTSTQAYSIEKCDILASLEDDSSSVSSPIGFNDIQPRSVIDACCTALSRDDENNPLFYCIEREGI